MLLYIKYMLVSDLRLCMCVNFGQFSQRVWFLNMLGDFINILLLFASPAGEQ